ncbi:hypothetical protein [Kitasatospora sp. MBT63]|uniref:hypothetical protein n=1 Tax=Kitasatospora sp. MBT63 TaxID=1444768 RepID=UPI001E331FB1|nr:hypothetical protein [Kitasatospora sp. MBT63]
MSAPTGISLQGRHNPLQLFLFFVPLTVEVDGTAESGSWRNRFVPLAPGVHQVKVFFRYMFKARCCEATLRIEVADGQEISLEYRAPQPVTSPGSLTFAR